MPGAQAPAPPAAAPSALLSVTDQASGLESRTDGGDRCVRERGGSLSVRERLLLGVHEAPTGRTSDALAAGLEGSSFEVSAIMSMYVPSTASSSAAAASASRSQNDLERELSASLHLRATRMYCAVVRHTRDYCSMQFFNN